MEQYKIFKQELKKSEYADGKNIPLAVQALIIYLIYSSVNLTGRLYIQQAYLDQFQTTRNSLENVQCFCYQCVGILGLLYLPKIVYRFNFRIILFVASLGPQIFLIAAYYLIFGGTNEYILYVLAILTSLIGGILSVVLLFGMLYYLSNLSYGDEKILYYCAFFFVHNSQWLIGSCIQSLFIFYQFSSQSSCELLIIMQIISSLLFLTIIEPFHPKLQRTKQQVQTLVEIRACSSSKGNQLQMLRSLIVNNEEEQEKQKAKSEEEFKCIMSNMTIQCFSLDQSSLLNIVEQDKFTGYSDSYTQNVIRTMKELINKNFLYLVPFILTIAMIDSFLYIQLDSLIYAVADDGIEIVGLLTQNAQTYFYVGLGFILGCFAMNVFGDFKDKFIWLFFVITLLQVGMIMAWLTLFCDLLYFVQLSACIVGFCSSGITSTIVSFVSFEFTELIYMTDVVYILYTICFGVASLLYIITNFTKQYTALLLIQVVAFSNYYFLYKYYIIRKYNKSIITTTEEQQ